MTFPGAAIFNCEEVLWLRPGFSIIALGALLGFLGQSVRVIVGLKKTHDQATALGKTFSEALEPSTLFTSPLIGAVAGALAALMILKPDASITTEMLLGLAAAGYSGADFVEGFLARHLPAGSIQPAATALIEMPPAPMPAAGPMTPLARGAAPVTPLPPLEPSTAASAGG
jgi:hypothetical protein